MNRWTALSLPALAAAVLFGLAGWSLEFGAIAQEAEPAESKDIEILGHGPIHEAFAQPASLTLEAPAVVAKKPPEAVEELPPDVKPEGDNVVWIAGYWAFEAERNDFIWISGFWRNVPPDRVWVAGYWLAEGEEYRWVTGYWAEPSATQVYYPPPPEAVAEAQAPAPNDMSFYVAGTWIYRESRYMWRPGYWAPYREGWLWTQPHYSWTPGGYLFVDGYWDYDFNRRGVLFAPAVFGPQYFGANRIYRPMYALSTNLLFASLFVRPSAGAYYFGDYYAPRYAGLGYTPWLEYRYRGRYADPAWSYYAWNNRGTPQWEQQMRSSYVARQKGDAPVPARRFDPQARPAQQQNANITQNVSLVVPVKQLQAANDVKLRPVTKAELADVQKNSETARSFTKARQNVESRIDVKQSRQKPVQADFAVPKIAAAGRSVTSPPPPQQPNVDPKISPKGKNADNPSPTGIPPNGKDPAPNIPAPPAVDPQPKAKDPSPPAIQPKGKDPAPTVPAPPAPVPQPKAKDPSPTGTPPKGKDPAPNVPATPRPDPQPKAKGPSPKDAPTVPATPPPTVRDPVPPRPNVTPPAAQPLEPRTPPAPQPKEAPPKLSAPPINPAPQQPPRVERPAQPPTPVDAPKDKGKKKTE